MKYAKIAQDCKNIIKRVSLRGCLTMALLGMAGGSSTVGDRGLGGFRVGNVS